jgi:hypothetical protein
VDAPTLFDLRCYLREGLVGYLQRSAPQGLPRTRIETTRGSALPVAEVRRPASGAHAAVPAPADAGQQDARLFTGSVEALERSRSFAGPGQDVIDEREEHAAEARAAEEGPGRSSGGRRPDADAPGTAAVPVAGTGDGDGAGDEGASGAAAGVAAAGEASVGVGAATGAATAGSGQTPAPPTPAAPVPAMSAPTGDTGVIPADDHGTTVLPAVERPAPSDDVEATQVQPAVGDDEPPAPPTRRSVRSTPLHPPAPR